MMACAVAGHGTAGAIVAIPCGILCGVAIGLVNGVGIAYLRIPSMIITLASNPLMRKRQQTFFVRPRPSAKSPMASVYCLRC